MDALGEFWENVTGQDDIHEESFARVHDIAERFGYGNVCKWIVRAYARICDLGLTGDDLDIVIGKYVSSCRKYHEQRKNERNAQ